MGRRAPSRTRNLADGRHRIGCPGIAPGQAGPDQENHRPPNYETPLADFEAFYTPNARFFVRYHLAAIPEVDPTHWKLRSGGDSVATPVEFTLAELRRNFETVELPAPCLCAGNRRGLFQPHVPGIQWGHGAMGNALWKGIRLRDVLGKANLKKDALEVTFDGADTGVLEKTPDFVKSLPLSKALDEHTLIAFAMIRRAPPALKRLSGAPGRAGMGRDVLG